MTKHRWKEIRQEIQKADICINSEAGFEIVKRFFRWFEEMERLIVFEHPTEEGEEKDDSQNRRTQGEFD